ncbi:UDP-N-acetylmuramoyl-tripeptide--D-alanyl-D-alanine ligase [Bifidobacterium cuniculi]|uniref:UDP-N-acetylmuramoyl-tripeptide--D-alanyl-D-alanine ligase n=1 Tax=Bifidobacterium cuniculi TaxID=1688 RepID=A0A087B3G0_9BIFI|nr:UDP-N-acetylmuramoyl-tripeptide--D-alanyl-D-alanine ligase [Bifidobacterium cuniculi]KFI65560.1 UDP-N-acetylmuramoyl-tripeptide--D-alanyl-D-alanine ligase [Bifidobacterium cuniculi]
MMDMTVEQAARAVDGRLLDPGQARIGRLVTAVTTDSRDVATGSLFVAIAGEHVDGHDFVATAASAGAVAALVDHPLQDVDIAQIVVRDTVQALGAVAAANLRMRRASAAPFTIVGITGSVGKTTTKDLLAVLLGSLGPTIAPQGSFNNEIGLPLTACRVDADTRFLVAEMGANHLGEIAGLTRIAPPDIAIVLKVGVAHLGEFGSVEHIAQAKGELVRGLVNDGVSILNADDGRVAAMARLTPGKLIWFGKEHAQAHDGDDYVAADDIVLGDDGHPRFRLVDNGGVDVAVTLGLVGSHNVMNALAAAAAARWLGVPLERVASLLSSVHSISPHRMAVGQVVDGDARFTLIDDSFNANPDSMKAGLRGLMAWHAQEPAQPYRVAVLGAMLELGGDEQEAHRTVGAAAAELGVDAVIAVGSRQDAHLQSLAQCIADGAAAAGGCTVSCVRATDDARAAVRALNAAHPDMAVLLKGSHASGLSDLADEWDARG